MLFVRTAGIRQLARSLWRQECYWLRPLARKRRCTNQLRDKKIRDDALKILEEHGSVILITEGKKKIIKVNPKLLED